MTASGLPISCAMPADSTPTVISFSARTSWFSRLRSSDWSSTSAKVRTPSSWSRTGTIADVELLRPVVTERSRRARRAGAELVLQQRLELAEAARRRLARTPPQAARRCGSARSDR